MLKNINRSFLVLTLASTFCTFTVKAQDFMQEGVPNVGVSGAQEISTAAGTFPKFTDLVKELSKAVVNVSVESAEEETAAPEDQAAENPFMKKEPALPSKSLGSGFILTEDGFIATNNHVVEKSENVIVRLLDDKNEYKAKLIGRDAKTDLALLKIEPKTKLHTVFIGDSDKLEVGEWVLAIGNQFQLGQTVTAGIVSAKSRRLPSKTMGPYDAFIQTDASINPGSSGGPLFNTKGQVIGINTAIFSPGRAGLFGTGPGFNIGIGFAIPINLAKNVLAQLKQSGAVTRGMLGVIIQRIDGDMAEALGFEKLGIKSFDGALVADILPETPASKAGFERKDIITKFNDLPIKDHDDLPLLVANTPIGQKVKVEVLRNGVKKELTVIVEELKDKLQPKDDEIKLKFNSLGIAAQELTEDVAKTLSIPIGKGALVNNVAPNSPAEKAGIMRGDLIEELNGEVVKNLDTFTHIVEKLPKDKAVLVLVKRAEGTRFLTLKFK